MLWQQVLDATCPVGLAPVCGASPASARSAVSTGGGLGPLARTYGLSCDHVTALEVVSGDGQLRRVTPVEHQDLYWALLGGKATLGIVTAVEIDLIPLSNIYGGCLWFDATDATTVLRAWRRMAEELPDEGTTSAAIMQLPPLRTLPPAIAGRQVVAVRFAWTGPRARGSAA